MSGANHSRKRRIQIGIALAAVGAITFAAVADGFAQRGGFGGGGFHGGNLGGGGFSTGGRTPGSDGPRNPGGGYPGGGYPGGPRFPGGGGGGIIVPGGYGGPGTVVVVDDGGAAPVSKRRSKKSAKKQKPQKQQQQQMAQRGGFHVPPANERRFVPNEVLLNISTATSARAVDSIAQKYRLTASTCRTSRSRATALPGSVSMTAALSRS